jgi:hypothetical protein
MSNAAQPHFLSKLDATAFPPQTIFVFICNSTGSTRRCRNEGCGNIASVGDGRSKANTWMPTARNGRVRIYSQRAGLLDTLTTRPGGTSRSSGSIACVTAMTPNTFLSNTARTSSRDATVERPALTSSWSGQPGLRYRRWLHCCPARRGGQILCEFAPLPQRSRLGLLGLRIRLAHQIIDVGQNRSGVAVTL